VETKSFSRAHHSSLLGWMDLQFTSSVNTLRLFELAPRD